MHKKKGIFLYVSAICFLNYHRGPAPLYSYPETDLPSGISS